MNKKFALIFILFFCLTATICHAQKDRVALWVASGIFTMNPASSSDTTEEAEYIDAFRSANTPSGIAYGIYLDTPIDFLGMTGIGLGLGRSNGVVTLKKKIDPHQTAQDSTDDLYIDQAHRFASNLVIFLKTIDFLTIGLGVEDGYVDFEMKDMTGVQQKKTFPFSYNYLHLSLAFGGVDGPYIALVSNITNSALNSHSGGFSGTTNGIIFGWIF